MRKVIGLVFIILFMNNGYSQQKDGEKDATKTGHDSEEGEMVQKIKNKANGIVVIMETSMGSIEIELDEDKAPVTVENFLSYVASGAYDSTIFHRVIDGFMIQGGGFTPDGNKKSTNPPIVLESKNGLTNDLGTIAMARTNIPDSATNQFFINLKDNFYVLYIFYAKSVISIGFLVPEQTHYIFLPLLLVMLYLERLLPEWMSSIKSRW